MSKLIFQNAAFVNTDTFPTCIKLAPEDNYVDTIYRNTVYTGQAPKIIRVKNSCVTPFTLPVQTLFPVIFCLLHAGFTAQFFYTFIQQ